MNETTNNEMGNRGTASREPENWETERHEMIGTQGIERRAAMASRIRAAREAARLSQGQVAREMVALHMKVHRPTISEIEAGRRRVSVDELAVFADLYGVTVAWLSCAETANVDPAEYRLHLAARELSRLKPKT